MTQYEIELHKLVECDEQEGEFNVTLERIGRTLEDLTGGNGSAARAIAQEVCFCALELAAVALLPWGRIAISDDWPEPPLPEMTDEGFFDSSEKETWEAYTLGEVFSRMELWLRTQPWSSTWTEYELLLAMERMAQATCCLLRGCYGDGTHLISSTRQHVEFYMLGSKVLDEVTNIDTKEEFAAIYTNFAHSAGCQYYDETSALPF